MKYIAIIVLASFLCISSSYADNREDVKTLITEAVEQAHEIGFNDGAYCTALSMHKMSTSIIDADQALEEIKECKQERMKHFHNTLMER
jgi:hypothetical protein